MSERTVAFAVRAAVLPLTLCGNVLLATEIPLLNWAVPSPPSRRTALADAKNPGSFVPMVPCRVADTRGPVGPFGGPILSLGVSRPFDIDDGPCSGIAPGASAYSLNFTVTGSTNASDGSFLSVWPVGGSQPLVSTLNFSNGQTIANAALVPAGTGGAINVIVSGGTHLIIDINGYYVDRSSTVNATESVEFYGNTDGAVCGLLFASNGDSNASECVSGVRGHIFASTSGSAMLGVQARGSGANFGVRGNNYSTSNDSAGVLGVTQDRALSVGSFPSGVRGESGTPGTNGVLGILKGTFSSTEFGVGGFLYTQAGSLLASGRLGYAGSGAPVGVAYVGGLSGSGTKSFVEPHPTDASRMIQYYSLEGPESGTYFRGTTKTVGGIATIEVPESFRMVTDAEGLTVQVTPTALAQIAVTSSDLSKIVVESSKDVTFHYLVQGVRRAYKDVLAIVPNSMFRPESSKATIPASLSKDERQRVIANGTYNADGTVNLENAERLGWARAWREDAPPGPPTDPDQNRPH